MDRGGEDVERGDRERARSRQGHETQVRRRRPGLRGLALRNASGRLGEARVESGCGAVAEEPMILNPPNGTTSKRAFREVSRHIHPFKVPTKRDARQPGIRV